MPRYELWSEKECSPDKMLLRATGLTIEHAKAEFENLIRRWEYEMDEWFFDDTEECEGFESKILPGAEEGCDFVLKDEQGKRLFMYTHEWEAIR